MFFQKFCDFFYWVNLSEVLVGELSWGLILGTVAKIKNLKQRAISLGLISNLVRHNFLSSVPTINAALGEEPILTF